MPLLEQTHVSVGIDEGGHKKLVPTVDNFIGRLEDSGTNSGDPSFFDQNFLSREKSAGGKKPNVIEQN